LSGLHQLWHYRLSSRPLREKYRPGFDPSSIITIELGGVNPKIFEREISLFSQILGVSASSHLPGRTLLATFPIRKTSHDSPIVFRGLSIDSNFLANLRISMIAGRNLPETAVPASVPFILINETAARTLGWPQPGDAVGQNLIFQDGAPIQVIGVVKDFSTGSLYERVEPCLLRYDPQSFRFVQIRIAPGKLQEAKALLEKAWRNLQTAQPLEFQMYEELIRDRVSDLAVTMKIVTFVAVLTIILSCLGLLGIANSSAIAKTKEIGVRKVVGATRLSIIRGLTKEYVILLGMSAAFGLPVSFGINRAILQNYARRISLQPEYFVLGLAVMLTLGLSVVLSQAVKAALANPVDMLRYE
jgi:putative ABC transport system permease protein